MSWRFQRIHNNGEFDMTAANLWLNKIVYLHFYTQFEVSWIGNNKWTAAAKPEHSSINADG